MINIHASSGFQEEEKEVTSLSFMDRGKVSLSYLVIFIFKFCCNCFRSQCFSMLFFAFNLIA